MSATIQKTVAVAADAREAMHKKAAKRPMMAVSQKPRSGNGIHGAAEAVGGLDMHPASANLGAQAVALAAVQPLDPAIIGHQEAGLMSVGPNEYST